MTHTVRRTIPLGPLTLIHDRTGRSRDIDDSVDCSCDYHLLFSTGVPRHLPWQPSVVLSTDESIILDTPMLRLFDPARHSGMLRLELPGDWLGSWLRAPERLAGIPIGSYSGWGAALNTHLAQLAPGRYARDQALSPVQVAIQIGSLLALFENDVSPEAGSGVRHGSSVRDAVWEQLLLQGANPTLTAQDVACAIGVSLRTLHRALRKDDELFGELLLRVRVQLARRMLETPVLWRLSTAEIGRRAGFRDSSHFARTYRRLCGVSPREARLAAQATQAADGRACRD